MRDRDEQNINITEKPIIDGKFNIILPYFSLLRDYFDSYNTIYLVGVLYSLESIGLAYVLSPFTD